MSSSISQFYNGDGRDGALVVSTTTALTYSGDTTVDASSSSGQKVLNVTSTTGFSTGDMIMIYRLDTGVYEIHLVDTVQAGVSLTLQDNLANTWTSNYVIRMPQYSSVSIAASQNLYCDHSSHMLAFVCTGAISGPGYINMGQKGYPGGSGQPWTGGSAGSGQGPGGGGAGGGDLVTYLAGGGAGHSSTGEAGHGPNGTGGAGGSSYGDNPSGGTMRPGSGGGGGGGNSGSHIPGANGGYGGGCIYIRCGSVNMGSGGGFYAQGDSGGNAGGQAGGGGGGSAGCIYIISGDITLSGAGVVYAPGGLGGAQSSSAIGGDARVGYTDIDCVSINYVPNNPTASMIYLDGYYDTGIRIRENGETVIPLCETVTGSHKLRVYDGATTYGVALVDTSDPSALATRIYDGAATKALKKQIL